MKVIDLKKLEKAQTEKFNFKIEDYLRQAFLIYSDNWVQFSAFVLIAGFIITASSITIVGPYILYYPLLMGYCNVVEKIQNEESFKFKDFFVGFKKWTSFLGFIALEVLISVAIILPYIMTIGGFGVLLENGLSVNTFYGTLTLVFLPIYLIFLVVLSVISFLPPYIIYFGEKIDAIEALRISYLVLAKNFWNLLIFIILITIISQFGFYICLIGALVSIPVANIMSYLFVKDLLLRSDRELDIVVDSQEI